MKQQLLILLLATLSYTANAQHKHNEHAAMHESHTDSMSGGNMSHAYSLFLPMNRNGSGTGWLPDNSPMYGKMLHGKKWMYMLHGNIFARYNSQDIFNAGSRGNSKFDAPNWLMAMGQRRVGKKGLFHFSTMLSFDAAIAGGEGYPLLFQSGETWQGKPLVDRQHPHDFFSELSVSYSHSFSKDVDAFIYLGYPGEPALGSVAFMHRPSALGNPNAPISHHWNDGTHITFGVATAGLRYKKFKIETSRFTGREPDENRWDFDSPSFNSWSGRLSYNPNKHWALQVSHGFIKSPEVSHPGEDVNRTTASAIYSHTTQKGNLLNATAIWGLNQVNKHGEHAFLFEASYAIKRWQPYTRYEWVQKSAEELALTPPFGHDDVFNANALTVGMNYDIAKINPIWLSVGAQATLNIADKRLDNLYGKTPMAAQVYLRVYPMLMTAR